MADSTGAAPWDTERALSFGERAVGVTFNPGNNPMVDIIKAQFAPIIDNLNRFRSDTVSQEAKRLFSVAITEAQTAQMWAVKALTWED